MEGNKLEVVALSDLNLNGSIKDALAQCIELDISVLISCPQEVTVWCVPIGHNEIISGYKKLEENGFDELFPSVLSFEDVELFKNLNDRYISPLEMGGEVDLLKLNTKDIKSLVAFDKAETTNFNKAYHLNSKLKFELIDSVYTTKYRPDILNKSRSKQPIDILKKLLIPYDTKSFDFMICDKDKVTVDVIGDPMNNLKPINITFNDCYIFSEAKSQLTEYSIEYIPQDSPYFVPKGCRCSSKLNQLAVLGHRFYVEKSVDIPTDMKTYIKDHLSFGEKESATARFFINPNPQGTVRKDLRGEAQFKTLVLAYKKFCIERSSTDVKKNSKSIIDFFTKCLYSEENRMYAAKLISPDLFRSGK